MPSFDPPDRCPHDHQRDECPICSDEELLYPSFEPLDLLMEPDAVETVLPLDLVGVPYS
ncbi:MAG: hypothetical protein JOZ56_02205 [Actinobacteria bacterium]|nr:hypothetical protein [Actinomycetota bacterium]MBV8561881.1 hypothetical protein [Actinomycetota bacterium]